MIWAFADGELQMTMPVAACAPPSGRLRRVVATVISAVLVGGLWIGAAPATAAAPRVNECVPPELRGNAIRFRSQDGVDLSGLVLGSGTKGVVLAHESGSFICSWLPFARVLASGGYHVIVFDHRNVGASGSSRSTDFYRLERDVLAAAEELTRRGVTSIVAGGASAGGTATMTAAPKIPGLAGVFILSSPRTFGVPAARAMNGLAGIRSIKKPAFFAAATENQTFEAEVRALHAASPADDKRLELVAGEAHGTALLLDPAGAAMRVKLLDFIVDTFRAAAPSTPPSTPASTSNPSRQAEAPPLTAKDGDAWTWWPFAALIPLVIGLVVGVVAFRRRRNRGGVSRPGNRA